MGPYVSRIAWLLAQPSTLIVLFLLLALILSFTRRRWLGRTALLMALALLLVSTFTTFGYWLITPLESRFERPAEPARIDGIVILGGGMDGEVNTTRGGWELNRSGDRMVEGVRLALRYPDAKVLFAGGASILAPGQESEALAARRMLIDFGIAPERIVLDEKSLNTEENARFAKELAGDTAGQTWLLVTSAFHMPRAVGLFRSVDFPVVPWPADYLASGAEGLRFKPDQSTENLAVTTIALKEWIGLAAYHWTGRTGDLLPAP